MTLAIPPPWVDSRHPIGRLIAAVLAVGPRLLRPGGVVAQLAPAAAAASAP